MSLFSSKTILLISPEPWNHIFVSKHHYAIHLARRGNRVFFLNPPKKGHLLKVTRTEYENLNVIDYDGFLPGLRFLPAPVQRFFIRRKFHQLERLIGTAIDIIWSFDNSVFFDFDALPKRVNTICHIVDLNQNFQFEKAVKTAKFCFCTTDILRQKMLKYNSNVYRVNHGLSIEDDPIEVNLPGDNFIKVLYLGNLAMPYLDWDILWNAAEANPYVDFIFIGPGKEEISSKRNDTNPAKSKLMAFSNVWFLDKVSSRRIQSYLRASDILLLAYQEKYHAYQANPHKMMEYLASGKPIAATFTQEYARLNDLICMSKKNADWPGLFQQVVENLDQFRHPEKVRMRKAYALDNTYDKQIDRIGGIIDVALRK